MPMINPSHTALKIEAANTAFFVPDLTYRAISDVYAKSTYGVHHAQQRLRFKPYAYDRDAMLNDLGA